MARDPEFERKHPRDRRTGEFTDKPSAGWVAQAAGQLGDMPVGNTPRRDWLTRATEQSRRGPLSDPELADRERRAIAAVEANRHLGTHVVHKQDGRWTDERAAMHRQVVDEILARHGHVPADREAILTGGLMGAGKTTVLDNHAGVDQSQYLIVSADEMKEELARRGLTPTIPGHEDLSPMEVNPLFHPETVHMADMLGAEAYARGLNVIYDSSMGARVGPEQRIAEMRRHGYTTRGIFVDIPVETSLERASSRYQRGMRDWEQGRGPGGRPIPPALIEGQRGSGGRTRNREVFDEMAGEGLFDDWQVYDNSGTAPRLIAKR